MSIFVIVGVRMALAIEMNRRLPPSRRPLARITQCGMVWDGSASMSTCSNSSCSDYRNSRCWSRHYSRSVAHDVFEDSHGGKVTTAPLYHPHERHILRFFQRCLLIFLHPCVLLCMLKALSTYVSKTTLGSQRTKVPRACLPLLLRTL